MSASQDFIPEGFVFVRKLNNGFYGPSYLIKNEETNDTFICKCFTKQFIGDENDVSDFMRIVKCSQRIREKCFLPFRRIFDTPTYIVGIRPFYEGLSLQTYITNVSASPNLIYALWKILTRLYRHLQKHKITPLFIKPSNIFIDNGKIAFVTDIYPPPRRFNPSIHKSTPMDVGFLAPEYLTGEYEPGQASDIWSLGVLLWFMTVKKLPWNSSNVVIMLKQIMHCQYERDPDMPDEIFGIITLTLVLDPDQRMQSEQLAHFKPGSLEVKCKFGGLPKLAAPKAPPCVPTCEQHHQHSSSAPTSFLNSTDLTGPIPRPVLNPSMPNIAKGVHVRRTSLSNLMANSSLRTLTKEEHDNQTQQTRNSAPSVQVNKEIQIGGKVISFNAANIPHRTITPSMGNHMMSIKMMTKK